MFKKQLSILCVIALLLSLFSCVLPLCAAAEEIDYSKEYMFLDFNEGEVVSHTVNSGSSKDGKGNTFYPFLSRDTSAKLSQENITVNDGGVTKTVSALKIEANAYSNLIFTDKNGKPFEARQGAKYTVKIKAYVKSFGKWSQFFYGFAFSGHDTANYKTENESISYVDSRKNDTIVTQKAQYAKFGVGSVYYSGKAERYFDTFDTSVSNQYYENTYTYTIENQDSATEAFIAHDSEGNEYELNNYFGAFLSMSSVTASDGSKVKSTVYIDSIEIYSEDYKEYEAANKKYNVTYYNGDDKIKSEQLKAGADLWNGAGQDDCYFEGWYTDKALTNLYSSATAKEDISLYAKFTPYVDSFNVREFKNNSKVNVYYTYNGEIKTAFDAGGWNYGGAENDKVIKKNTRTWAQSGAYVFHDQSTGNMLVPEPGATYDVTVKYIVDSMDATNATLSIGYGMKKEYYADLKSYNFISAKKVATFTADDISGEEKTATATFTLPESLDSSVLPCLGIYTTFSARSDLNNEAPVSKIIITEGTVTRKNTDNIIAFDGASVLTDEMAEKIDKQAMRVYFGYTLNENGKIVIDGEEKDVIARGILMKDSSNTAGLDITTPLDKGVVHIFKNKNLEDCWNYDSQTGRVTFSAFINRLDLEDERSISVRGYIVTSDGNVYYSKTKQRSVKQVLDMNINSLPANKTEKEKVTIMLVIGQSNAEGAGYTEEKGIVAAANGMWELSALPTVAPYGDVFMSTDKKGVTALGPQNEYSTNYIDVKGGFAPAYAAKWNELTGEKVVILQLALGATSLAEWQKDANVKGLYKELNFTQYNGSTNPSGNRGYNSTDGYYLYNRAVTAYNATYDALSEQYEISHSFYVWNQGESNETKTESDSTIYGDEQYAKYFEKMHEDLLNDCKGMTMGTIIAVRSCRATSHSLGGNAISGASTGPRRAQYRLAFKRDDLNMVSWFTESCNTYANFWNKLPTEKQYGKDYDLVPSYKGCSYAYSNMHYTQLRYNEMGADAAINLYNALYGETGFDGVAVRNANYQLIGKFGTDGSGSFSIKNDGTIGTRYLQIRPEDASCTYDFALHIDKATMTLTIDLYTDGSHHASGDEYITEYGEINWSALEGDTLNIVCKVH